VYGTSNFFHIRHPTLEVLCGGYLNLHRIANMTHSITEFNFKSSLIRIVNTEIGDVFFVAIDVAKCLGYSNTRDAITSHCKHAKSLKDIEVVKRDCYINQQLDEKTKLIPESDVYRLTMRSKLAQAEEFQNWVCEKVLPSIRKTGSYGIPEFLKPITESIPIEDFEWRYQVITDALKNLKNATVTMKFTGAELLAGKCFEK
jgi:prophage antirepressor-like protein